MSENSVTPTPTEGAAPEERSIIQQAKDFLADLFNITSDKNEEGTIQTIKDSISMKGHTAWVLIFSIVIASVGLNANSTAVVIGAMLISPLMGPILGLGLSIGINDLYMLRRSLNNLGVMVGLSLATSFLFFSIPLFQDETSELLARTRPDIRDVLIAMSGGLALIVAITRPTPQTNTVAGVAIATALMPPLCTAGYGLAMGNWSYFFGAMFLFTINTIFIALATYGIVKFLRFRLVEYINPKRRKYISRLVTGIATVIIAGSIFTFSNLVIEKQFTQRAKVFIAELKNANMAILGDDNKNINYGNRTITLPLLGQQVSPVTINRWNERLVELGLTDTRLIIQQEDESELQAQVANLQELYINNNKLILSKQESIREKEDKIRLLENELQQYYKRRFDYPAMLNEIRINYPDLLEISYSEQLSSNFQYIDTLAVFNLKWDTIKTPEAIVTDQDKLYSWLLMRMKKDTVVVRNVE